MKAIVKTERKPGCVQVIDVPKPALKPDEVMVKMYSGSICGSDIHAYHYAPTHHYIQVPVIMGHEGAGEIVQVGSAVTDLQPGEKVVIEPIEYCQQCEYCLRGKPHLCASFQIRGMHGDGFFAEFVAAKARYIHKLPEGFPMHVASLIEPVSVLAHALLDRSEIKAGELVMVTGPGPIGLIAAQMVKALGAEPVVVGIDSDEETRLPLARKFGYQTINFSQQTVQEALKERYGRETVDAVVECSGAGPVLQTCLDVVAKGGAITLVGLFTKPVEVNLFQPIRREATIYTSFASNWHNFERAIRLVLDGKIDVEPLISYYSMDQVNQAFEDAIHKKVHKPVIRF
ncbi:zinc-dependent alcohol dehydrogenase [Bacillus horti]|uniref:L-iditol 2-dehydrogenase n=1 Tax=Caldalkalibacillus horti TaxID=77523 RepID=A0ABT9VVY7_9BACI|nr:alcohol dehydrogenase catalytic domain-containing protein [Bacillus horti]MDQ0165050.1 L-iditol 2-dehydrogenase [Bacillus horti]